MCLTKEETTVVIRVLEEILDPGVHRNYQTGEFQYLDMTEQEIWRIARKLETSLLLQKNPPEPKKPFKIIQDDDLGTGLPA